MVRRWLPKRLLHGEEATLVEHLDEFRTRLIVVLFALVPAFLLAFVFHEQIQEWLIGPLPDDKKLVTLGVTEPFTTSVKVSLIAGLALALPVLLWQIWAFFAPAVEPHFQRVVLVFVVLATALFATGVAFMYYVVLPRALDFLTSYDDNIYNIQIRASYYYNFAALTLLAGGLAFLMPIFVLGRRSQRMRARGAQDSTTGTDKRRVRRILPRAASASGGARLCRAGAEGGQIVTIALATDETLLILKIAFLVLLYGFIVLVVRTATKDIGGAPQESIVLGAAEAAALRVELGVRPAQLLVVTSPELAVGSTIELSASAVVGRDAGSGIRLDRDEFVSARHARIEPRPDGIWIEDLGSTNGTHVNGARLQGARALRPGDVVRIGETELQVQR